MQNVKVAGFVLTGGHSTRMGQDKALLPIGSQTLCEYVGDVVSAVSERVFLVGHPERYRHLKYECLADLHPGLGPLSGLETALAGNLCELHVVVSCDSANLRWKWLRALLAEAQTGARCVVLEDAAEKLHPLCGVYRRECLPVVSQALSQHRLRMMDLLQELKATRVKIEETLLNVNTPEDYADSRE